ncbi:MAG: winged helix-turn-helix transcriptional regulator [Phormidesmis sp.]
MITSPDCTSFQCPIQYVLDMLGSKWSILILRELWNSDRRTHELLSALPGISSKTLTVRLRNLEEHGIVERRAYAEVPPRVEYALTAKGKELQPVLTALHQVGEQWLDQQSCVCPVQQVPQQVPQPISPTVPAG